jgi:uncharacterized membrane protein
VTATSPGEELLERLAAIEQELRTLRNRVELLENRRDGAATTLARTEAPPLPAPETVPPRPRPRQLPSMPRADVGQRIEEIAGERLLAVVGGAAIVLGAIFFFSLAIERGWIGEAARVLIAAMAASALLALGVWLQETRGHAQAALAAVGAAVASLYLLAIAIVKVAVVDLSQLESIYRVLSPVALGLLLLIAAYAYQRLRPPDEETKARPQLGSPEGT